MLILRKVDPVEHEMYLYMGKQLKIVPRSYVTLEVAVIVLYLDPRPVAFARRARKQAFSQELNRVLRQHVTCWKQAACLTMQRARVTRFAA